MARSTPPELHLVTLKGESDPSDLKLEPARVVSIGRTGNVKVHDSLVSIHHAKLYYDMEERAFVVEDLNSANGTFVNGECIRGESRLVRPGTELRFGDTVLEVQRAGRNVSSRIRPLLLAMALLVMLAWLGWGLVKLMFGGPAIVSSLPTPEPVMISRGQVTELALDDAFLWEHGIGWELEVHHVTRIKELKSDLVWLSDWGRERVVAITFDDQERWQLIGDLPGGGRIAEPTNSMYPSYLDASGGIWTFEADRSGYRLTGSTAAPQNSQGLVVWYRKQPPKAEEGEFRPPPPPEPLEVGRYASKGEPRQLSLFLTERNVQASVHYIVCEGAFPGVQPQVLTYEGTTQELSPACLGSLRVEGTDEPVLPVAIALDEEGRQALVDDVVTFYSGDPDGLFLDEDHADLVERVRTDPGIYKGAVRVAVVSNFAISPPFDPFPPPKNVLEPGSHVLIPNERDPMAPDPAAPVQVHLVPYPGVTGDVATEFPTTGCEKIRVVTHQQYERPSMFRSTPFAEVSLVGCGDDRLLFTVPFTPGTYRHDDPKGTDVALRVEMDGGRVRTAEIGWRP